MKALHHRDSCSFLGALVPSAAVADPSRFPPQSAPSARPCRTSCRLRLHCSCSLLYFTNYSINYYSINLGRLQKHFPPTIWPALPPYFQIAEVGLLVQAAGLASQGGLWGLPGARPAPAVLGGPARSSLSAALRTVSASTVLDGHQPSSTLTWDDPVAQSPPWAPPTCSSARQVHHVSGLELHHLGTAQGRRLRAAGLAYAHRIHSSA